MRCRRYAWILLLLSVACEPLVAVIGVEGMDASVAPEDDAAPAAPADAKTEDSAAEDAAKPLEAAVMVDQSTPDAAPLRCIDLPDLIDPMTRSDGGVRSVETDEVWANLDPELGCPMPAANYVTYGRKDGAPLVPAGRNIALAWAAGTGSGSVTATSTNLKCGGEAFVLPFLIAVVLPLVRGCAQAPAGAYLRLAVNSPTPFPNGLMLCESTCPLPEP